MKSLRSEFSVFGQLSADSWFRAQRRCVARLQQQLCAGAVFCFFKGCVWGWIMVGWPLGFGCLMGLLFYE